MFSILISICATNKSLKSTLLGEIEKNNREKRWQDGKAESISEQIGKKIFKKSKDPPGEPR